MTSATTLDALFRETAARHATELALRSADGALELTWSAYRDRAERIAAGLAGLGVRPGDTVASLLTNRVEFHLVDVAVLLLGATPFSIYPTSAPEQVAHQLADAGARVLVTENALAGLGEAAGHHLDVTILVDAEGEGSLAALEASGLPVAVPAAPAADPQDLGVIIYTSGTTGPSKGVELTHANILGTIAALREAVPLREGGRTITYLPHAHLADRMVAHYLALSAGTCLTCVTDPRQAVAVAGQIRPTHFLGVPRIWEKLHSVLAAQFTGDAADALAAAVEKVRLEQDGAEVPAALTQRVAAAESAVFAPLRERIGFGELDFSLTGAAPIPRDVQEFFLAIGIPILEVWGMSETSVMGTMCRPGAIRVGSVGRAFPGVELRLADDGELLVRGPNVMRGYRNLPELTRETISPDGWLATGDVATIDEDGYVRIVDRKKELIINAAGKNMSPANIESCLKTSSPLVGLAVCIGDARPYNVALLVPDPDGVAAFAAANGLEDLSLENLAEHPLARQELLAALTRANGRLSRVEQIKRAAVVAQEWAPGGDELTPTLKLKRKPIAGKYEATIEALYDEDLRPGILSVPS